MRAGRLNKRVTFQREIKTPDGRGGFSRDWETVRTVAGCLAMQKGRDVIEAGAIAGAASGLLAIRYAADLAALGAIDRVLIDGVSYSLAEPVNPDQRKRALEFVVERGRAI